jgi:hypothetical protein
MRAFEFLREAEAPAEKKVGREFNHLEDLVFTETNGAKRAVEVLKSLAQDAKNVSIKWDGCIHPDLLLETNQGAIRIEELIDRHTAGELFTVLARDLSTGEDIQTPVLNAVKKKGTKAWVEIVLENNEVLKVTEDHEIFTTNRGWIAASKLTVDDDVKTY